MDSAHSHSIATNPGVYAILESEMDTAPDSIAAAAKKASIARALRDEAASYADNVSVDLIGDWCQRAHDHLASVSADQPAELTTWKQLLLPLFLTSNFLQRCHLKPRGYAGDYLTIQMMYDVSPKGIGPFGKAVDVWAMGQPCPRAVRNRRLLVKDFVRRVCGKFQDRTPSIVSLGCGPAAEVFDVLSQTKAHFTLIDIDSEAIEFVRKKAELVRMSENVQTIRRNIVKMALKDEGHLPPGQSAFYSMGLIDYFGDEMVIRLLNYVHDKLAVGGMAFLGNFKPGHANAAFFQHALDWPLVLRSEAQLVHLVRQSKFADSPIVVGAEPEGVQLFIECTKTGSCTNGQSGVIA